ncbi:hypothetical protein [Tunturiibacter gelidoferens]|jgi:hypothetical protein|uniref:Uncharacterized protein n=1 Tax=Tunturiibacter gelidiferens TaxID=3069689 RepID=A0ACC5NWG6_9BACT|nr:hypothetical protein [Edaphobacter lichenicola]MBB5338801.1 hypothetical protein [Edaphobacter lichenicola]
MVKKTAKAVNPVTNKELVHLAGEGLQRPSTLTADQVRKISAGLLERVRKPKKS